MLLPSRPRSVHSSRTPGSSTFCQLYGIENPPPRAPRLQSQKRRPTVWLNQTRIFLLYATVSARRAKPGRGSPILVGSYVGVLEIDGSKRSEVAKARLDSGNSMYDRAFWPLRQIVVQQSPQQFHDEKYITSTCSNLRARASRTSSFLNITASPNAAVASTRWR